MGQALVRARQTMRAARVHRLAQRAKDAGSGAPVADDRSGTAFRPGARSCNPQENIWQPYAPTWLSDRVFKSYEDIVDHCCCYAWTSLRVDQPWKKSSHVQIARPRMDDHRSVDRSRIGIIHKRTLYGPFRTKPALL